MGVRDRRGIDARAGLELPKRFPCVLVESNELTRQFAGEYKPAAGRQHAGRTRQIGQRDLPFLLARQWVDRHEVTEDITRLSFRDPAVDAGRGPANDGWLRGCELLYTRDVPGARVDEARVRIERDWHRVCAARRPDFDLFAGKKAFGYVSQHRSTGGHVDMRGPIDFDVWVRGYQFAVRAVQHIHEAVLVGLNHHLPKLATNLDIREDILVGAIDIVHIVGRVLKITNNLTRFRPDREHAGREQAIQTLARSGIVWLGIARSPIDEIELGIVGTGAPRRPSALHPGVAILGPGLGTRLAGRWDGVSAPQFLPGVRIPAIEEPARGGLSTGHAGNQHAVGNDRPTRSVVAICGVGEFLVPELFAGLHVECEHVVVNRHAKEFAVIDRRRASVESGTLDPRFELDLRAPDLPAGFNVDGEGPPAVDHIHDAVVNRRRCQFTLVIHEARAPDGDEALDIGFIDLLERAVTLSVVAHALGGDVFRVLAVVDQLFRRLGQSRRGPETE